MLGDCQVMVLSCKPGETLVQGQLELQDLQFRLVQDCEVIEPAEIIQVVMVML